MRAATLGERRAFLLALLGKPHVYHGTYIAEKVSWALNEHASPEDLVSALDSENKERYYGTLHDEVATKVE